MVKTALPVSHLFSNQAVAAELVDCTDCLEVRDNRPLNVNNSAVELYHSEFQIIHFLSDENIERIHEIVERYPQLQVISFHAASCCDRPYIQDGVFMPGGHLYTKAELLETAEKNVSAIRNVIGTQISLAVENNNYYDTPAYQNVTDTDFISSIADRCGMSFLFDTAHAIITATNRRISYREYVRELPLQQMIQVHVSRCSKNSDGTAYDAHDLPRKDDLEGLRDIIRHYSPAYVTPEYYKDAVLLIKLINQMKEYVS